MSSVTRSLFRWTPLALVLFLALIVFGPSLGFEFVEWDDPTFLTQNPLVIDAPHQSALDEWLTPNLGYPIPFTVLTYRLENALFGVSSATPYHVTNVLLHLLGIALLYAVARRLNLSPLASAFAAAFFGLHPAVAESVSWVTGRKDLLMTVATLGALWLVVVPQASPEVPAKPSRAALVWSALLCVIALLSKPTGACAALVAGIVLAARVGGKPGRLLALKTYSLPILITIASIPIGWINHDAIEGNRPVHGLQLVREAWYALGYHLGIVGMVRPNAAKYLPMPWPPVFKASVDLLPLLVIALVVILYRALAPERRVAARVGLLLAVAAYLPSSNLIPLTRIVADAYVHLSLAGLGLFLAAGVDTWSSRSKERAYVAGALGGAFILLLSLRTWASSARYQDSLSLWAADYEEFPHDYRLCRNLGNAVYMKLGAAAALDQYRACGARHGNAAFERNEAFALVELGRLEEAEPLLRAVLQRAPDDTAAQKRLEYIERRTKTDAPH